MPIGQLLINMSLPIMISMLVQALYNIVDSIFVAQINENALTAVSLAFPVQNLMISIAGYRCGVQCSSFQDPREGNYKKANDVATNSIFRPPQLRGIFHPGPHFSRCYYVSQTGDAQIIAYGVSYLTIV